MSKYAFKFDSDGHICDGEGKRILLVRGIVGMRHKNDTIRRVSLFSSEGESCLEWLKKHKGE